MMSIIFAAADKIYVHANKGVYHMLKSEFLYDRILETAK